MKRSILAVLLFLFTSISVFAQDANTSDAKFNCADGGSTDSYTCNLSPAISSYRLGTHYLIKANTSNTGAATVSLNGLAAKTIKKNHDLDLVDGDIEANAWFEVVYDGTFMQMLSQPSNSVSVASGIAPLVVEDANTVAQRNGVNSQALNIYKTFTDASNYERLKINSDSTRFYIRSEGLGTGNNERPIRFLMQGVYGFDIDSGGNIIPITNVTHQLGDSTHRWNKIYTNEFYAGTVGIQGGWLLSDAGSNGTTSSIFKMTSNSGVGTTWGSPPVTPAQITANQNDYATGNQAYFARLSSDASRNITGFSPSTFINGEVHRWTNVGSFPIVIKHQDTNSVAQNRFLNSTGADITLATDESIDIIRDDTVNRWRATPFKTSSAASIGGSTGATDNAILRADGTGGATVQNTGLIINDSNQIVNNAGNISLLSGSIELRWDGSNLLGSQKELGSSGSRWSNLWIGAFSPQSDTPTQITANQNNYNPGTQFYIQRLSSDASRDITGINPGGVTVQEGQSWLFVNVGSFNIVLKHESASSSAANRFLNSTGADITLAPNQAADVFRDVATQRYRVFKRN